jgi:ADP-heptose:LPS heptosyltransferase
MPDRVLLIRNDKLGDFMLAWPSYALLKQQYPDISVVALVPAYTAPMAELCPWIDEVMTDERGTPAVRDIASLTGKIRKARIDASISLFSETRTALSLWLAGVPERFGPATKLAQLFLNNRLLQKRSESAKPELEYNVDLVRFFIQRHGGTPGPLPGPPYLTFSRDSTSTLKHQYYQQHGISSDSLLVFIHPGSGGSAINLSLQQFAQVARMLAQSSNTHYVITAGPGELEAAEALSQLMAGVGHSIYHSTQGIVSFSEFIAICDLFISGSTGPLHIAGALNVATAAFYPARQSATALRWQTLNQADRRLAFSPEKYTGDDDMKTIDIEACVQQIGELLHQAGCTNT